MNRFEDCLPFVLAREGGYTVDSGGPTMKGVTQSVYEAFRSRMNRDPRSVQLISDVEVSDIYYQQYWRSVKADDLPKPIDLVCFDSAVNCGVSQASKFLQRACGVKDDGKVGAMTLAAVSEFTPLDLALDIIGKREWFYQDLAARKPEYAQYLHGWMNRCKILRSEITK